MRFQHGKIRRNTRARGSRAYQLVTATARYGGAQRDTRATVTKTGIWSPNRDRNRNCFSVSSSHREDARHLSAGGLALVSIAD